MKSLSIGWSMAATTMLVVALDLYANVLFTDFWNHPAVLRTKLGIIANEVLSAALIAAICMSPALVVARVWGRRAANIALCIGAAPCVALLIGGWSFYAAFERFLGIYAFQMMAQDGGQMIEFLGKMPSSHDPRLITLAVTILLVITSTFFLGQRLTSLARVAATGVLAALLLASVPASLAWNKPYIQTLLADAAFNQKINRIQAAEFSNLQNKAGPFSALAENIASHALVDMSMVDVAFEPGSLLPREVAPEPPRQRPVPPRNVVVFVVESLRPDMLAAFGNTDDVMPAVNRLAAGGYAFSNMWAQASHSNYADIAVLSAQYPLRSENIHFYEKTPQYPRSRPWDTLKPLGYHTGVFSSQNEHWGLMSNYLESPELDVFSHVGAVRTGPPEQLSRTNTGVEVNVTADQTISLGYRGFMFRRSESDVERLDSLTMADGLQWLATVPEDSPVFAYFNLQASHYPFNALPDDYERRFLTGDDEASARVRAGETVGQPLSLIRAAYQDALTYVDSNISLLVEEMKRRGQHRNTLYVVTADTSMSLATDFLGNGGALLPDVLHIPALIVDPGMSELTVMDEVTAQIDLMPTVLNYASGAAHPASQGIDLLARPGRHANRTVYSVVQTPAAHQYAAITDSWMLVHDFDTGDNVLWPIGSDKQPEPLDKADRHALASRLQLWMNRQLAYYDQPGLQERYNPPLHKPSAPLPMVIVETVD